MGIKAVVGVATFPRVILTNAIFVRNIQIFIRINVLVNIRGGHEPRLARGELLTQNKNFRKPTTKTTIQLNELYF